MRQSGVGSRQSEGREAAWSWAEFHRQYPELAARSERAPEEPSPETAAAPDVGDADDGHVSLAIPDALWGRLMPYAEARGWTVGTLALRLLQAEVDADLIDATLDGDWPEAGDAAADDDEDNDESDGDDEAEDDAA